MVIAQNVLVYTIDPWDIQLVDRRLQIREAARQFLIDITFAPPNRILIERGRFLRNGVEILLRPDRALITNNATLIRNSSMTGATAGIVIGAWPPGWPCLFSMPAVSRYLGDRKEAEAWAREAIREAESLMAQLETEAEPIDQPHSDSPDE